MSLRALLDDRVDALDTGALFSACRRYRYCLWRRWDIDKPVCLFVGLNPSTADETVDDPTIRRCVRFAKDWGYGTIHMANIFAYRATDPMVMRAMGRNAIGPLNNEYLTQLARAADLTVAAWGTHGIHQGRGAAVRAMLLDAGVRPHVLGLTKNGYPKHPLYLPGSLQPMPWVGHG